MIIAIIAQSFNLDTGKVKGNAREEIIDTSKNDLFKNCSTLTEIVEVYWFFWNKLPTIQKELVLVQTVRVIKK